jgi:hypothetical protein
MAVPYKHPRGTRTGFTSKVGASSLVPGQVYILTDEQRLIAALSTNTSFEVPTLSEVSSKLDSSAYTVADVKSKVLNGNGGGTANFLRADGTWAAPPTGSYSFSAGDRIYGRLTTAGAGQELTGGQVSSILPTYSYNNSNNIGTKGLVPPIDLSNELLAVPSSWYLSADGNWYAIPYGITFSGTTRLYGRYSPGGGSGEEIFVGAGLILSPGGVLSAPTNAVTLSTETTTDAAPGGTSATGIKIFAANRSNRRMPAFGDPTGKTERLQPFLGANDIVYVDISGPGVAASATTGYNTIGTNMAADVGTTFGLPGMTTTNYLTMQNRKTVATAATAASLQEIKAATFWCSRRSVGGGFHFITRFGLETAVQATGRLFAGLTGSTAALTNVDPSTGFAQSVGIYKNTADTALQLMLSAAAGTVQTVSLPNTGAAGWNVAGTMFQLELYCATGDAGFGWRVVRFTSSTGASVVDQGYVSSGAMPAIDTLFCPHIFGVNVAAAVQTLAIVQMYCESD